MVPYNRGWGFADTFLLHTVGVSLYRSILNPLRKTLFYLLSTDRLKIDFSIDMERKPQYLGKAFLCVLTSENESSPSPIQYYGAAIIRLTHPMRKSV